MNVPGVADLARPAGAGADEPLADRDVLRGVEQPNESDVLGDDPQRRCPDITKARALLGWEPTVGLEEGLSQTIKYFRSEIALQERTA